FLSAIERHRIRLAEVRGRIATLQFGGAVGTLAALGERGMDVAAALAEELQLALPDLPWHAQRDRVAEVATMLGLLVGTLGKLANAIAAVEGLQADPAQMAVNLDITHGLILAEAVAMALGEKIGKMKAHELVEEASARAVRERRHLRDVLLADSNVVAHLAAADLERLLDPRRYTGQAERLVARALAARKPEGDGSADA